ncbi:MAG: hypothetical protein FJX57_24455, partial [Alphaproteobacteria bacterium]|nr:hypothetical protein [Alphaproteobacteria bacterium]
MTSGRDGCFARRFAITISIALATAVAGAATPAGAQNLPETVIRTLKTFAHNGRQVRVEEFRPLPEIISAVDGLSAVILLHGASGIRRGTLIYSQAQALAENGIVAYVLHYYDGMKGGGRANARPSKYDERKEIIENAVSYVQRSAELGERRIGLWGYSLGAFHALGLASQDQRIGAVAAVAGAMPRNVQRETIETMPPTLIVHGGRDRVVPVGRAKTTAAILDDVGADYVINILKSEAHVLKGKALTGTIEKVTSFFGERLAAIARAPAGMTDPKLEEFVIPGATEALEVTTSESYRDATSDAV